MGLLAVPLIYFNNTLRPNAYELSGFKCLYVRQYVTLMNFLQYLACIFILTNCTIISLGAQEYDISFYADVMMNAEDDINRSLANEKFTSLFQKEISTEASFGNSFEKLKWLLIQYPTDSSFRTITWQIDMGEKGFKYYGFLQYSNSKSISLGGAGGIEALDEQTTLAWDDWKGGLIYKILSVPKANKGEYLLLTYRQKDQFTKAKTCELLTIDGEQAVLGKRAWLPIGSSGQDKMKRLKLVYSADSNVSIQLSDEGKRISFDNLITMMGRMPNQGPTLVPDGSYKAYDLGDDGNWSYVEKVFTQTMSEAPRADKIDKGKDIFGQTKKKNK